MEHFFDFKGGRIHYRRRGKGPAVVLIHGFLESLTMWSAFEEYLSDDFQVLTLDLPGHGLSSPMGSKVSMELMAEAVKSLLDLLQISRAVVIGHSMGGYVSLAFAQQFPEYVQGFGLFHSHAAADTAEGKINRGRAIKVVEENHKSFISAFIPDLFSPAKRQILEKEIALMQEEAKNMSKEGIIGALQGMRERSDGLPVIKNSRVPVMFIIGRQDSRAPMEELKNQISLPAVSHVLFLKEAGHMGFIEAFEESSRFVYCFAKQCFNQV